MAIAISRIKLSPEHNSGNRNTSSEYQNVYNSVQKIVDGSSLICNRLNCVISIFDKKLFENVHDESNSDEFITLPEISCPNLDDCKSDSKFVETSYLPAQGSTKILQYFHVSQILINLFFIWIFNYFNKCRSILTGFLSRFWTFNS